MQLKDQSVSDGLPVKHLQHEQMDGISIATWQVYFARGEEMVRDAISFKVSSGHSKTNVLFTGMYQGDWYLINKADPHFAIKCPVRYGIETLYQQLSDGDYVLQPNQPKAKLATTPTYSEMVPTNTGHKQSPRAMIQGKILELSNIVFGKSNQCLVDAVPILESLGVDVKYDSQQFTARKDGKLMTCENGQAVYQLNNEPMQREQPIAWQGDIIMLPLDVLAGFLQMNAKAQPMGNVVYIDEFPQWRKNYPSYSRVTSTHDNGSHPVGDAVDGNPDTYFASQGTGVQLLLDMGKSMPINAMSLIWYRSDVRHAYFSIETSLDNKQWQTVFDGKSSGTTPKNEAERFTFETVNTRYVRITSNGNSQNDWNSICEAMVVPGE